MTVDIKKNIFFSTFWIFKRLQTCTTTFTCFDKNLDCQMVTQCGINIKARHLFSFVIHYMRYIKWLSIISTDEPFGSQLVDKMLE